MSIMCVAIPIFLMKHITVFFLLVWTIYDLRAQSFPSDPDSTLLVTSDIDNFWKAFDLMDEGYEGNPFADHYIEVGSAGVADFIPYRIEHADTLYKNVKENKEAYLAVKENTFKLTEKKKEITAAFYALKYWLPEASYPPVYFVIGNFNSGGTSSENGLIIGAEMQQDIDNVPIIVAHELIHFQQGRFSDEPTLLEQCLHEGMADFIGEMISGRHINTEAHAYAAKNKEALCREFVGIMATNNWDDWLYGTTGKDERPNDLGYWIGYEIAKAYFNKQSDKHKAFKILIAEKDAKAILSDSGFLDPYLD